jgi:nucleotide-binding universal stress UspA family protein
MDVSKSAVADSSPAHGILHYLENHQADLLVLATHQRHGLDRWLHQNIAGTINNKSDGATLFIPYGKTGFVDQESGACRLKRILLPVDLTPDPAPTVKLIADLVQVLECQSCEIVLLHVGDPAAQPAVKLPVLNGVHWQWSNREGSAIAAILEEASDRSVDLIAMTTSGRHGFLDAIRGSTTEQIVELAMCPVLAVHES